MLDLSGKYQTNIIGWLLVIILGSFGAALWEVALRPSSSWLLRKILSAATLGLSRAKNNIYKRIALGQEEQVAKFIAYYLIIIISCGLLITILFFKYNIINGFMNQHKEIISMEKDIEEIINPSIKKELTKAEKIKEIKQAALQQRDEIKKLKKDVIDIEKNANIFYIILVIFIIFWTADLWIEYIILIYINSAIRYFNQLFRICAPLIPENDRIKYLSEFARIKSPQEYKNLIENLKKIAKDHEFDVPDFGVWGSKE